MDTIIIYNLNGEIKYVFKLEPISNEKQLLIYQKENEELGKFIINKNDKLIIESYRLEKIFESNNYYLLEDNKIIYTSLDNLDYANKITITSNHLTIVIGSSYTLELINKLKNIPLKLNDREFIDYINDYIIVKYVLRKYPYNLQYASENLRNNLDIVKIAVSKNANSLQFASENLRNNLDIVKMAVSKNGHSLQFASEDLRNNFDIVNIAVSTYPEALQFASNNLKNNKKIVILACLKSISALKFASDELQKDYNIIEEIIKQSENYISLYSFLEVISEINMSSYEKLCNDEKNIKKILYFNIKHCIIFNNHNRNYDKESINIIFDQIKQLKQINNLLYEKIINDYKTIKKLILMSKYYESVICFEYILKQIKEISISLYKRILDDVDIAMYMIKNNSHTLKYFSENIKDNENIIKMAVNIRGSWLKHASLRLRDLEDIVIIAIKNESTSIKHASNRLKNILKS
jgi:hypothetical protein